MGKILCVFGFHRMKWEPVYVWRGTVRHMSAILHYDSGAIDVEEKRQEGACERCGFARRRTVDHE